MSWTQEQAIDLCCKVEMIAPDFGAHVALTGGTLYRRGPRKDVDILFYRIRQTPEIDIIGLLQALVEMGFVIGRDAGWCVKASYDGRAVDLFFPERPLNTVDPAIVDEYGLARALS